MRWSWLYAYENIPGDGTIIDIYSHHAWCDTTILLNWSWVGVELWFWNELRWVVVELVQDGWTSRNRQPLTWGTRTAISTAAYTKRRPCFSLEFWKRRNVYPPRTHVPLLIFSHWHHLRCKFLVDKLFMYNTQNTFSLRELCCLYRNISGFLEN